MKIDRISYQKTFNLGNYCSEKVGVEMEVEPGEAIKALDEARKFVEGWHRANNPQIYDGSMPSIQTNLPSIDVEKSPTERLMSYILSCSDITVLESYKLIVKDKPDLQSVYNAQLAKLTIPDLKHF